MTRQCGVNASGLGLIWLMSVGAAHAQTTEPADLEEVVVTGFRQSLENAALDKRSKTNFTDSIFAEDIGKFPDLNLAESLQRLPGIQIERDASGEGARVNIRGLGPQLLTRAPSPLASRSIWIRSEEHTSELQSQSNLVC